MGKAVFESRNKKAEDIFYRAGILLAAIAFLFFIAYKKFGCRLDSYMLPCIFHEVTGYYCPGCGGTRAVYALFSGKFLQSFCYQPFVLYAFTLGGWFLITQTIERLSKGKIAVGMRYRDCYLWIALGLILIHWGIKNIELLY